MTKKSFTATAWKNDKKSFGLSLTVNARDCHFYREWNTVELHLSGFNNPAIVNIEKRSFWDGKCRHLISMDIRKWLDISGKIPWEKGHPPKIQMKALGEGRFEASLQ